MWCYYVYAHIAECRRPLRRWAGRSGDRTVGGNGRTSRAHLTKGARPVPTPRERTGQPPLMLPKAQTGRNGFLLGEEHRGLATRVEPYWLIAVPGVKQCVRIVRGPSR